MRVYDDNERLIRQMDADRFLPANTEVVARHWRLEAHRQNSSSGALNHKADAEKVIREYLASKQMPYSLTAVWEAISFFVDRVNGHLVVKEKIVGIKPEKLEEIYRLCEDAFDD